MQFFDLSQQFNLSDILTPNMTLEDFSSQEWYLAKVRVEHDCVNDTDAIEGQAILKSNQNIQLELEWQIVDTGHELLLQFKGIDTPANEETLVLIKGTKLVDVQQKPVSAHALSLWIDGTLMPMLPNIHKDIKARLNLWDYVEYDG